MRFFTPELFVKLNSESDDEVDDAEAQWEATRKAYQKHFRNIETKLPRPLVKLCNTVPLHDASVVRPLNPVWMVHENDERGERSWAVLSVRLEDAAYDLIYLDPIAPTRIARPVDSSVFSEENVIWLYDEVSFKRGVCTHEILFSNGAVLSIEFKGFKYTEMPLISQRYHENTGVFGRKSSTG